MKIRIFILLIAVCYVGSAVAQSNCWPQCVSDQTITMAFRLRRPSMTISGTDECREEIKKMIENFDREDQALKSFTRNACAALSGWVEINPGTCSLGGPFCCTAKPSHWRSDVTAWSRFIIDQTKIGNQRKAEVEAFTKRCSNSAKASTSSQQNSIPKPTTVSPAQQQSSVVSQPTNINVQQFSKELNKTATQKMLANFGKDANQQTTNSTNQPQTKTASSNDKSTFTEITEIAKDILEKDFTIEKLMRTYEFTTEDLTKEPQRKTNGDTAKLVWNPLESLTRNRSPEIKQIIEEEYKKFLAEVEKNPELKKKGSKLIKLPNGEKILLETASSYMKRGRIQRTRPAVLGHRG